MSDPRLERVLSRLQSLPALSLPSDYPRPTGAHKLVEAAHTAQLSHQTSLSLLKLALFTEDEDTSLDDDDEHNTPVRRTHIYSNY